MTISASVTRALSEFEPEEVVRDSEPMHRISGNHTPCSDLKGGPYEFDF
jgi:hypothetical protein